jgi:hypothetical protein
MINLQSGIKTFKNYSRKRGAFPLKKPQKYSFVGITFFSIALHGSGKI